MEPLGNSSTNQLSCIALYAQGKNDFFTRNVHPELLFDSHHLLEHSRTCENETSQNRKSAAKNPMKWKTGRAESLQISQTGILLKQLKGPKKKPSTIWRQLQ